MECILRGMYSIVEAAEILWIELLGMTFSCPRLLLEVTFFSLFCDFVIRQVSQGLLSCPDNGYLKTLPKKRKSLLPAMYALSLHKESTLETTSDAQLSRPGQFSEVTVVMEL